MEKDLKWAIKKLKEITKESHIKGQFHIDLTLADANERDVYMEAMIIAKNSVTQGEISEANLKERIGLV